MEDEVEWVGALSQAQLLLRDLLAHVQDLRAQLHVARLVDAVDVAEGCGQQVAALLPQAEDVDGLLEVLFGGVEVCVRVGGHAVFLATDDADLNLEDDVRGNGLVEQVLGDLQILVDRGGGAVPHVGLEQRGLAGLDALAGDL